METHSVDLVILAHKSLLFYIGRNGGTSMIMIDIPMPDNCAECRFENEAESCKAMPDNFCGDTNHNKRPEWCPLKDCLIKAVINIT